MMAVVVAKILVSEATSKMDSSEIRRAIGLYVSRPNEIYISSVLDISAATAPGNILPRTESLRTESTSALSLSDRLFAFIANWPALGANDTLIEVICRREAATSANQ
jgi:hypothetical protein